MTTAKWLWAVLFTVLAAGGCGKKPEPLPTAASASARATVASAAGVPSAGASGAVGAGAVGAGAGTVAAAPTAATGRTRGMVGKFLPADCPEGRIYLDVAGLAAIAGAGSRAAQSSLAATFDPSGQAKVALEKLAASGLDLARDVRELAICARSGDDVVFAADVDLSHVQGDLHELIVKIASASGGKFVKKHAGSLDYVALENEDGALARVSPTVLVAAKNLDALAAAAEGKGAGFAEAGTHLAYIDVAQSATERVKISVSERGDKVVVTAAMTLAGAAGTQLAKDPKAALAQTKKLLDAAAARLETTGFKPLAADVKTVELTIEKDMLIATVEFTKAHVRDLVLAVAAAKPADFAALTR